LVIFAKTLNELWLLMQRDVQLLQGDEQEEPTQYWQAKQDQTQIK